MPSSKRNRKTPFARFFWDEMDERTWGWNQFETASQSRLDSGSYSRKTIQNAFNQDPPLRHIVINVAKVFELDVNATLSTFKLDPVIIQTPILTRSRVLEESASLTGGDEVWLISSNRFIEDYDQEVRFIVTRNLEKGVIYKYFFPLMDLGNTALENPLGKLAHESYRKIKSDVLKGVNFKRFPLIFGFTLDAHKFHYFSKLTTLLLQISQSNREEQIRKMYCYVKHEPAMGSTLKSQEGWVPLPESDSNEIIEQIKTEARLISDREIPVIEHGPPHSQLKKNYNLFLSKESNLETYSRIQSLFDYSTDSVKDILDAVNQIPDISSELSHLDIGCGDGKVISQLIDTASKHKDLTLNSTLIDISPAMLEKAQENLSNGVEFLHDSFESADFGDRRFDLITSIHSFYTINLDYLRKVYRLLAPGGIACFLISAGESNVFNIIANELDNFRYSKKVRNLGEDLIEALHALSLDNGYSPEIKINENSIKTISIGQLKDITSFFGLVDCGKSTDHSKNLDKISRDALSNILDKEQPSKAYPLRNYFITMRFPN